MEQQDARQGNASSVTGRKGIRSVASAFRQLLPRETLRFLQPQSNGSEDIIIGCLAIVEARGIKKDNIASTAVRVRTADSVNILSARLQVAADVSGVICCRYIDELSHGPLD